MTNEIIAKLFRWKSNKWLEVYLGVCQTSVMELSARVVTV